MDKLIITAAVTGGEHGREANPNLPITPEEIADAAIESYHAGAAIAHLHVWDENAQPTQDLRFFRRVYERVQANCDMILNPTTGPGGQLPEADRLLPLQLRPELATFDAGSMNFGDYVFENSPGFLRRLAQHMLESSTVPELEIYDEGMIHNCQRLHEEGLLKDPLYFQFVLGTRGGAPATAKALVHLVESLPPDSQWGVTGIGKGSVGMAMLGIVMGGHVRVGLEDSVYYRKGEFATSNAQLVARVARLASEFGREIAKPVEARRILGLRGSPPA